MIELGVNVTVLRIGAFFYENVLLAHSGAIRETGVFANCFGDARPAWISATDAADLCVTALLEPQAYANTPIVYPPGHERLSQQQIADITGQTSVNVNRVLADMERSGLIRRQGREIEFTDWSEMRRVASFQPEYLHI